MKKVGKISVWEVFQQIAKLLPFRTQADLRVITLCLVATTTFWFFSALNKNNYNTRIQYPIKFVYDADSTILLTKLPETITLDVTGGGWNLLRKTFLFNSEPVVVNLEDPTKTKAVLGRDLAPAVSEQLGDLELNEIVTDSIRIDIEPLREKRVSLTIRNSQVKLDKDYRITSQVSITPDSAIISGPESYIKSVADTIMIDIPEEDISDNFKEELPISLKAPDYVNVAPAEASVAFNVEHFSLQKAKVRAELINFPADSSFRLNKPEVTVTFWIADQYKTDSLQIELVADLDKMDPTDSTIVPDLIFYPENAKDIKIMPEELRVVDAKKR